MAVKVQYMTRRPPIRSAATPAGSRHSEPLSTATAMTHESWTSDRPNSALIGLPRMPNISHTANITVKPIVLNVRTRLPARFWSATRTAPPKSAVVPSKHPLNYDV